MTIAETPFVSWKSPWRGRKSKRGYLLPMALTFLIVLLLLELSLITLQGRAAHTELDESGRLALLLATENLNAELLSSLSSESAQRYRGGKASARLDKDFSYTLPGSDLTITNKWSPNSSLHHDTPAGWATFSNLVSDRSKRPALAFDPSACLPSGLGAVAPGQTVVSLQSEQEVHQDSLFAYTELFPFGLYAPRGNIAAGQISSFSNRCYDQSQTEQSTLSSGRPVDVLAKGDVAVAKTYSSGRAISGEGKVRLPEGSGGVPISGRPYPEALAAQLSQDLVTLSATLAEGCVNKTRLFDDALFSSQMLSALFKGDLSALGSIFSVGQACKVPFFPIPGIQNGEPFMIVFYIMPPYPVDFSGLGRDLTNDLTGLDEQTREIQATQKQVAKLQAQLQSEQDKTRPDEDRIQELEDQLARTQQSLSAQLAQARKTSEDFDAQSQSWAEKLSQAPTPSSQVEDARQNTQGWSYLYLMGKFLDIANALLGGEDPFADMVSPSRVVHLGGENPGWSWSEDSISIKATLAVPRGRTLHLAKSRVTVQGDVYLQPGAVLSIEGDLSIAPPADWNDFVSVPVEGGGFFPNGRLIMDPGSSLIVSGDLTISGGTPEGGSVVLTSAYGPCAGIDRLISAGGSIEIQNGMSPGVQLGDMFDGLAKSNSSLEGFNDKAFRPLVEQVAPQVAKLPWFGPWNYRRCWFADYASTFVISPLLVPFGEGGPWIFPLPYENCLKRIFADLSIAYSSELNFFTGENLYSQSYFWLFGRGATPVLTKVRPDLVARSVKNLSWQSVEWEAFRGQAESFLAQNGRSLVVQIFESEIVEILNSSALELVPLTPPNCGNGGFSYQNDSPFPGAPIIKIEETDADPANQQAANWAQGPRGADWVEMPEQPAGWTAATTSVEVKLIGEIVARGQVYLANTLNRLGEQLPSIMSAMAGTLRDQIDDQIDKDLSRYSNLREVPGVVVFSRQKITVGLGTEPRLALGLFVAGGDVNIDAQTTVGCVVSTGGDIEVDRLLHYPYFDRASFYNPKKFGANGLLESLFQLSDPQGDLAGDVALKPFPGRLAHGWR